MITLNTLTGLHELSGVDRLEETHKLDEWGGDEACQVIRFVLDGITYAAIEDPSDGYRSMMGDLHVSDTPVANRFTPIQVLGVMVGEERIVNFYDTHSARLVLAVGTDYSDSYYPSFVANFWPENMNINQEPSP